MWQREAYLQLLVEVFGIEKDVEELSERAKQIGNRDVRRDMTVRLQTV